MKAEMCFVQLSVCLVSSFLGEAECCWVFTVLREC